MARGEVETCASAAAEAPNSSGATTLAAPNARPSSLSLRPCAAASVRRPKATPRTTIAITASVNGASRTVPEGREPCREGGEQDRDREDQPDVVCLPQRSDRARERVALLGAPAGGQVEDAGPKSAPAKIAYAVRAKTEDRSR